MENKSLTLYCCCDHDKFPGYKTSVNNIPIIRGYHHLPKDIKNSIKQNNFLTDGDGDNISHLNPYFGDLTTLYYVWKNCSDEYIGMSQYRRIWDEKTLLNFEEDVLYISEPVSFHGWNMNLEQQYYSCHDPVFDCPSFTRHLSLTKKIPIPFEMLDACWKQQTMHPHNMVFGSLELFRKYCELVFECTFPLFEHTKHLFHTVSDNNQKRNIAMSCERLMTTIMYNSEYFFGKQCIRHCKVDFYP